MTIQSGDIKLVASQVMADVPEGGGAPTATVIEDGASNAIFPDISELDRAGGRVNIRKVFVRVETSDTDTFYGANVIVAEPPKDPRVSVTLFSTEDVFDRRTAARNRIESYLAPGPVYAGYLFGNHLAGQMTVTLLQRVEADLPVVGTTLVLRKNEGQSGQAEQFVRITSVTSRLRSFDDNLQQTPFQRREVTCGISDQLRYDFPGFDALRYDASLNYSGKTKVYETVVADAARYFGVVPLAQPARLGDYSVNAQSIFSQLVPSAQIETPIVDARMNQQRMALVPAGDVLTQTLTLAWTPTQALYVGGGIMPGTLTVTRSGVTITDSGGKLVRQSDGSQVGTVDYANGVLTLAADVFGASSGTHSVAFQPASTPTVVTDSIGIPVTQASQGLTWTVTIDPAPAKGSLQISYRAQGRWYVLTEDGSGAIRGSDAAFGAGTINFQTGGVALTLGALPDVGSEIIVTWAPSVVASRLPEPPTTPQSLLDRQVFFAVQLPEPIKPGSLSVTWNDGQGRSATDVNGGLAGDAKGEVLYSLGIVRISPNTLPAKGTVFTITTTNATASDSTVPAFTDGGTHWTFTVTSPVRAGSVEFGVYAQCPVREFPGVDVLRTRIVRLFDDGLGNIQIASVGGNVTVGAINYSTGACSIVKAISNFQDVQGKWENRTPLNATQDPASYIQLVGSETRSVTLSLLNGSSESPAVPAWAWWAGQIGGAARARYAAGDAGAGTHTLDGQRLFVRVVRDRWALGSDWYARRAQSIHRNPSPATGEGTPAGGWTYNASVEVGAPGALPVMTTGGGAGAALAQDYSRLGYMWLDTWTPGVSPTLSTLAGVVEPAIAGTSTLLLADKVTFRTAVAPLRNGSFGVAGTWEDGTTFTATADANGRLATGSAPAGETPGSWGVFGVVDYQAGVVKLRFGRRVSASMASAVGVTDLSYLGIPGVQYVQSRGVQADTLRYNAAAYTYLPLDADIIGIDPVRLPSDGRVPIFRAGSFAVVGHTGTVGPVTVSNGQTINCARVRLSRVRVIGADGQVIHTGYAADLEAGTVTFTDVTGYAQPVKIEHRVEDMVLVSDAQINGQLTFTRPLTHDYPGGSFVSSALVIGDMYARVSTIFDQATWDGSWRDDLVGSPATGTYNDVLAPIAVTNRGAVTERWAIRFTSSTSFEVIGEHVGVIATGNTASDCAPLNPATGAPYFSIPALGWGSGWAVGNVLRFNTVGALFPVQVVRTVQQGPESVPDDHFTLLIRGDVDTP